MLYDIFHIVCMYLMKELTDMISFIERVLYMVIKWN